MSINNNSVIVSLDALGCENGPGVCFNGAKLALDRDSNLKINIVGPKNIIKDFANCDTRIIPTYASEHITMSDHPAISIRKKKDSSIVVGCKNVKKNFSDGFFSCGNTGAVMAAATLLIGRIRGVIRPCLSTLIPAIKGRQTLFCDVGANADCKPEYLNQFGIMADLYLKYVEMRENINIALLNIGSEDTKGNRLTQDSFKLMSENIENFYGNAEGRDVLSGEYDAIITDGFTGNVVLKTMEGTLKTSLGLVKNAAYKSFFTKIGGLLLKSGLRDIKKNINPDAVGGAVLLGIDGVCVIGHGNSNEVAVCNGILKTAEIIRSNITSKIANKIHPQNF